MADSSSETAITLLTGPLGGGGLAFGLWTLLKEEPCTTGSLPMTCAHFAGQTMYGPTGLMTAGTVLGFVIAGGIVLLKGDDPK